MNQGILSGVRVADFSWFAVGPLTTKYVADHGATVVRIESVHRLDGLRLASPFRDGKPGINRSGTYANFNSNKLCAALNLKTPEGRDVARRFVAWADVLVENFTPGVMARLGLDYAAAKDINPGIIYMSTSQMGQDGPYAHHPGLGLHFAALSGFYHLSGWPDRPPAAPYGAYTDFLCHRLGGLLLVAALDYRRRTDRGVHIDMSQLEAALQFLAPTLLDYSVNDHIQVRCGNESDDAAPHGIYPCHTPDTWCAIAVETDAQWEWLCRAMGSPPWSVAEKYATFGQRKNHEQELNKLLADWTQNFEAVELMELLQSHGVPAGVVSRPSDLFRDAQLAHRGHFVYLEHPEMGRCAYDGTPFQLSLTPGGPSRSAPCLGADTDYVYTRLLGMSQDEVRMLKAEGVLT